MLYLKKLVKNMSLKVMSNSSHYFFPSFWQYINFTLEKRHVFCGYPRVDPFFGIFIRMEVLLNQAMCHRSEQVNWKGQCLVNMAGRVGLLI